MEKWQGTSLLLVICCCFCRCIVTDYILVTLACLPVYKQVLENILRDLIYGCLSAVDMRDNDTFIKELSYYSLDCV